MCWKFLGMPTRAMKFAIVLICLILFITVVARSWGGLFFVHSVIMAGTVLLVLCMLLVMMMNRHASGRGPSDHESGKK
jgi:hypothetical protein